MESADVILVVEDNDEDYEATVRALRRSGVPLHFCRARNGREALDFLHRRDPFSAAPAPALVLLDLNLPGTDGRRILEQLKSHPDIRPVPVVVLTTSSRPLDVESCYRMGANSYLVKNVDFARFVRDVGVLVAYWFGTVALPTRSN